MSIIPSRVEVDLTIREMGDKANWENYSPEKNKPEWVVTTEKTYNSIDAISAIEKLLKHLRSGY